MEVKRKYLRFTVWNVVQLSGFEFLEIESWLAFWNPFWFSLTHSIDSNYFFFLTESKWIENAK